MAFNELEPYDLEHDEKITRKILEEYFIDRVHLAGIPNKQRDRDPKLKRWTLHFRITLECKPKPEEETKAEPDNKKGIKEKKAKDSKVQDSKKKPEEPKAEKKGKDSKAQDSKNKEKKVKEGSPIFVVIDMYPYSEDIKDNNGKWDVPMQTLYVPIAIWIQEHCYSLYFCLAYSTELKSYAHSKDTVKDAKFTFPFSNSFKGKISLKEYFRKHEEKGRLRFKPDEEGNGCVVYVKAILSDMQKRNWFEDSDLVKKNFETINSFKKNTKIGKDYYIPYGIGTFF